MTNVTIASRLGKPNARVQSRVVESSTDIFLKRSAAYYHAQPPSSLESARATTKQRDPMLADTLQSLAPPDTRFSPASMHARLQTAQRALTHGTLPQILAQLKDKSLIGDAQTLQQQIGESLFLQQEAIDNQRLLIKA